MMILLFQIFKKETKQTGQLSYSQFLNMVEQGEVSQVTIQGDKISGNSNQGRFFRTFAPKDLELIKILRNKDIEITAKPDDTSPWYMTILVSWFPMILLIGVWIFFMRQMQAGGGKALSFGKSRARLATNEKNKVTFDDVAGIEEAKEELQEIIEFLRDPKKFTRLGGRIPKGVLLVGAPGTGKTLLARAIAGEAGVPFLSISGSDFVEMFVGVGASRVRDLFVQGKKNAPCIIFLDEIDAVGRHRGAGLGGGHDEREQTLNQLLVEMDGFESNEGVILISATNRPDVLDPALLRPGRFDRQVVVPVPDVRGRESILNVHTKKTRIGDDVDLSVIARGTPGFTGADLENMTNEAALLAARRNKDKNKVTIIPRGRALGLTQQLPLDDKHTYTKEYLLNNICILMGGRISEEIALNTQTTGASNDIERATEIARKMICEYGMNEKLGPLSFGKKEEEIFLGREIAQHRDYSEETAQKIDQEVNNLIDVSYKKTHKLISNNLTTLNNLAKALLEKETLNGSEIDEIVGKKKRKQHTTKSTERKKIDSQGKKS